ncbi:MAG TPA: kelch repeat-containing protein [Tepidisphaeraceae bacterium]|nr:kelch repeat-containing protein [Tepidisphaeraceae bacterium]
MSLVALSHSHKKFKGMECLEPRRHFCTEHTAESLGGDASVAESAVFQAFNATTTNSTNLQWTEVGDTPQAREEGISAVSGSRLYMFGGFFNQRFEATPRVDIYNPATNTWSRGADMMFNTTHTPIITTATRAFFFGGYVGRDPGPATAAVQIYNFKTNKWTRGPDMPSPRGAHAAVLSGNMVYLFGGRNKPRTAEFAETWSFNIDTNEYKVIARMPDPRNHLAGAAVDGQIYAIGGQKGEVANSVNLDLVHRYNPNRNRWFAAPDVPAAISHQLSSTLVFDKKIITVGGETSHNVASQSVRVFDPYANSWSSLSSLPLVRRAGFAGIVNDRIYMAGGSIVGVSQTEVFRSVNLDTIF